MCAIASIEHKRLRMPHNSFMQSILDPFVVQLLSQRNKLRRYARLVHVTEFSPLRQQQTLRLNIGDQLVETLLTFAQGSGTAGDADQGQGLSDGGVVFGEEGGLGHGTIGKENKKYAVSDSR
jgi:hypothetical protein